MATRYSQTYEYYPNDPWPVDSKSPFANQDEINVNNLDTKVTEANESNLISPTDQRRDSLGPSVDTTTSPRDNMWEQYPHESVAQSRLPQQSSHDLFNGPNPFVRIDTSQAAAYAQQSAWSLTGTSGSCTPTSAFDTVSHDFTGASSTFHNGSIDFTQVPYPSESQPNSAIPMSPESSQGWMSATSSDAAESRSRPVRSPPFRIGSPSIHLQRDGIRKKNARFEIPAERTLSNIDTLIKISTDEQEVKELKQQKRLLRNRQAALDSRQRKKLHTEKLEEEKKTLASRMDDLEDALADARRNEHALLQERAHWQAEQQRAQHYIDSLHHDRDEMIRAHTLETGELRKKVNILREHLETLERSTQYPQTAPGNVFTNDYNGFDNIPMTAQTWDDFAISNDFEMGNEPIKQEPAAPRTSASTSLRPESARPSELPFSLNAFYMCLLFGAFIASNSLSNPSANNSVALTHPAIPPLSEEYRAESANVLKAVLASAPSASSQHASNNINPRASGSSSLDSGHAATTISSAEMAHLTSAPGPSNLDLLHSTLSLPSRSQANAAAFALTPGQYAHLQDPFLSPNTDADGDFDLDTTPEPKPLQSNLQRALEAMRGGHEASLATASGTEGRRNPLRGEVYDRSLLWESVPEKVVRDFQEMVRQVGGGLNDVERT